MLTKWNLFYVCKIEKHRLVESLVDRRAPKDIADWHSHGKFEVNEDLPPVFQICSLFDEVRSERDMEVREENLP